MCIITSLTRVRLQAAGGSHASHDNKEAFNISRLAPQRNNYVYERLERIVESDYFQTLLARRPPNDDPEVINLIR